MCYWGKIFVQTSEWKNTYKIRLPSNIKLTTLYKTKKEWETSKILQNKMHNIIWEIFRNRTNVNINDDLSKNSKHTKTDKFFQFKTFH